MNFKTSYSCFVHLSFGFEVLLDHFLFLRVVELRQDRGLVLWAFKDLYPHLVDLVNYLILVIHRKVLEQCFEVGTSLFATCIGWLAVRINFVDTMMPGRNRLLFELLCSLMLRGKKTLLLWNLWNGLKLATASVCYLGKDVRCDCALLITDSAFTNPAGFVFLQTVYLALIRVGPQLIGFVFPVAFLEKFLLFDVVIY